MNKRPESLFSRLSHKPPCPQCQGLVKRAHRTVFDRLRGLFMPRGQALLRYRCVSPSCAWTGSVERPARGRNVYGAAGTRRHVLDAARMSRGTRSPPI